MNRWTSKTHENNTFEEKKEVNKENINANDEDEETNEKQSALSLSKNTQNDLIKRRNSDGSDNTLIILDKNRKRNKEFQRNNNFNHN